MLQIINCHRSLPMWSNEEAGALLRGTPHDDQDHLSKRCHPGEVPNRSTPSEAENVSGLLHHGQSSVETQYGSDPNAMQESADQHPIWQGWSPWFNLKQEPFGCAAID